MELADRVELRRFVGRELLLWLWFESEIFEATLSTPAHGSFGLWLEGRLVLSEGREVTTIRGSQPGNHREAKESLLRGKLPDLAGIHLSWGDHESSFVLKAETLGVASLSLPTVLDGEGSEEGVPALGAPARPPPRKRRGRSVEEENLAASDEAHEAFYERMRLTRQVEEIIEALYAEFLALRLTPAWDDVVSPALRAWVEGRGPDADGYRRARDRALASATREGKRARRR